MIDVDEDGSLRGIQDRVGVFLESLGQFNILELVLGFIGVRHHQSHFLCLRVEHLRYEHEIIRQKEFVALIHNLIINHSLSLPSNCSQRSHHFERDVSSCSSRLPFDHPSTWVRASEEFSSRVSIQASRYFWQPFFVIVGCIPSKLIDV